MVNINQEKSRKRKVKWQNRLESVLLQFEKQSANWWKRTCRKKQGKGTFVCQRKVTKDMKKLQSFSEMCAHMGMKAGGRMFENRLELASEKIARL